MQNKNKRDITSLHAFFILKFLDYHAKKLFVPLLFILQKMTILLIYYVIMLCDDQDENHDLGSQKL